MIHENPNHRMRKSSVDSSTRESKRLRRSVELLTPSQCPGAALRRCIGCGENQTDPDLGPQMRTEWSSHLSAFASAWPKLVTLAAADLAKRPAALRKEPFLAYIVMAYSIPSWPYIVMAPI